MTADGSPSVSVVVATHDRRDLLARHLPVLLADPGATEVVVVDDGSTDGTAELLAELASAHPRLVAITISNSGTDRARRTGVERARGEVVLLLDDDVRPSARLVSGHARRHSLESDVVVVGWMPTEVPDRPRPGGFATALYAAEYDRVTWRYEREPLTILTSLWNGNVSIRRSDYLRAHVDEVWPHRGYQEDANFGIACLRAGLEGRFDRTLEATHVHRVDLATFRRTGRRLGFGRYELCRRHADVIGNPDPEHGVGGLGPVLRRVVRIGDRPTLAPALAGALHLATIVAGRARWWWLERRLGQVLRRVEIRIGAREAMESWRDRPPRAVR